MREGPYQGRLIRRLEAEFPGCIVLKNDASYIQGIPDLLVLHGRNWGMLEVKASANSPQQPNQQFWVNRLDQMSFADFIYPTNEERILHELSLTLRNP